MPRRSKQTFILKGVDTNAADIKFGFDLVSNIGTQNPVNDVQDVTKISDLPSSKESSTPSYSYLDEANQPHVCTVTMKSLKDLSKLPHETDIHCFWCRHGFSTSPIGCPIKHVPGRATKSYYSQITKDTYQITDNLPAARKKVLQNLIDGQDSEFVVSDDYDEYFVVDGIFCSFNCALAYAKAHPHDPSYAEAQHLLYALYTKTFNVQAPEILPAPDWRLLESYGGSLSIEEFRKSFETSEYHSLEDFVYKTPQIHILGRLFEKRLKF